MPRSALAARAASYYELTKPGIAGFVTILAGVSFYVGARGRPDLIAVLHTLFGTALATAGALALNQYAERDLDARMARTRTRPLPSGRMEPREALAFGALLLAVGVGYLAATVGWLPSALTALSAAAYLLAYTPLKSRTYLATLVGAFPGAFPALIGWTAATGRIELGAMVLFGIAFLWQLPHVLALAWLLREDYARVGFFLTPPTDPTGARIGRHMVYHSVSLLVLSAFPSLLGITGALYLAGAMALGLATLALSSVAAARMTAARAPRLPLLAPLPAAAHGPPPDRHGALVTAPLRTLALAALLSAGGAGAASAQADTVTFRFAFPVGTEAQVRYTKVIEREEAGPPTRIEIEGEYSMHVHPHPSGLLIEHLDPLATRFVSSPALAQDDPRRAVYGTIGAPIADWVVSGDGQLLGLSSVDVIQDAVTRALAPLQLDEGAYQAAMAELVSEPALMGNARDLWRAMVESWADAQMVAGEAQADQADEINPIVPSVTLPYRYEYSFVGMEPCPAPSGSCAHLQVVSFPDPRELTRTMSEALQQLGLTNLSFERLVQLNTMTVLTDPTTLLPQAIEVHKQVDGILLQDGRPTVFRRGDQTQLIFTY